MLFATLLRSRNARFIPRSKDAQWRQTTLGQDAGGGSRGRQVQTSAEVGVAGGGAPGGPHVRGAHDRPAAGGESLPCAHNNQSIGTVTGQK